MKGIYSSKKAAFFAGIGALRIIFGGAFSFSVVIMVIFAMTAVAWFGSVTLDLLQNHPLDSWHFWAMLPIIFVAIVMHFVVPKIPTVVPDIRQYSATAGKVLIWFLSPPIVDASETDPEKMRSWRMAFEAIKAGVESKKLQSVVVIASSDSSGIKEDGSWRDFPAFKTAMFAAIGEAAKDIEIHLYDKFPKGVDFEDAKHLYNALDSLYHELNDKFIDADIVVDITGGQKMPAVVGGIVGLGENRRIQYVSTRDYKIHEYDISYKVDPQAHN